jgi:SAM-dependent methyltransferase
MPILKTNPEARVTGTDIAPTCLTQLKEVAQREGVSSGFDQRVHTFVADSADPTAAPLFENINADAGLIMFTLSAVPPKGQAVMLSHAFRALRPGGILCIRDHGLYDMVQLRIPPEQCLGPNMYRRGDNTLAYFFSVEDMRAKAESAGFGVRECEYVCVYNRNRKTGQTLRRVFVHGVFVKPAAA